MKRTFHISPTSVASLVYVRELSNPGVAGPYDHPAVYMSAERGVVCGRLETPLASYGWPQKLQDAITEHFKKVFELRHEDWNGRPFESPRAVYVDSLVPWVVEVEEQPS